jgi:hypothetical protein
MARSPGATAEAAAARATAEAAGATAEAASAESTAAGGVAETAAVLKDPSVSSSSRLCPPLAPKLVHLELSFVDAKVLQLYTPIIHSCSNLKHLTFLDLPYSSALDNALDDLVFSAQSFAPQLLHLEVGVLGVLSVTCTPFFSLQHLQQLQVLHMHKHNMEVATGLELRRLASRTALTSLSRLSFRLIAAAPPLDVSMPNLTTLSLNDLSLWVKHNHTWQLSTFFPNLTDVTVLTAGSAAPGRDVGRVAVALRGLTGLRRLTLGTIAGDGAYGGRNSLLEIGQELPGLRYLMLGCYGPFGLASQAIVLPDLSTFPHLEEFEFGFGPAAVADEGVNVAAVLQWLSPLQLVRQVTMLRQPGLDVGELQAGVKRCLPALQKFAVDAGRTIHVLDVPTGEVSSYSYRDGF